MLFRASLFLACVAAASAELFTLEVKTSINGGDFVVLNNPTLANIPCDGEKTITFKVNYHTDVETGAQYLRDGKLSYQLNDVDEAVPGGSPANGYLVDGGQIDSAANLGYGNGDFLIPFTFRCTPWDPVLGGCVLDYKTDMLGIDTTAGLGTIDGEKASYAYLSVDYWINGFTNDNENLFFDVGCEANPVVKDDPHFKGWSGKWYDYMGECDLVFVDAPYFGDQEYGMKINIRTKTRYDYSFIESAVIKIGEETFEVGSWGQYFLNGVEGAKLPATISGFKVTKTEESEKVHKFQIEINDGEVIEFKTYKDWVSVGLNGVDHSRYHGASGMMGSHDMKGKLVGRDGATLFTDMDAFANEWQVRAEEEMLFHTSRLPQAPQQCITPSASSSQRRLGEKFAYEAAEAACAKAGWSKSTIEMCIHDVMATGDLELATVGAM